MWKDISSYSRGDKAREPSSFQRRAGKLVIVVTRHIHYSADEWVLTCEPLIAPTVISKGSADEAKIAALKTVRENLEAALATLSSDE